MRNVFPTDQVFHLFAHQSQPSARNGSNVHFDGPELYSYSTTIAAIIGNIVYISDNTMSGTTGKHIRLARQATRHMEQFSTSAFTWSGSNPRLTHEAMILPAVTECLSTLDRALSAVRTRQQTKSNAISAYLQRRGQIIELAERVSIKIPDMPIISQTGEAVKEYQEAKRLREEKKEAARLKAAKKRQKEDKAQFNIWRTTGAGRCPYSFLECNNDFITLQKSTAPHASNDRKIIYTVTTSQGAECPLDHAVKALKFWESRRRVNTTGFDLVTNKEFPRFEPYHTNGHKIPLGAFTLDSIDEAGTVKAGCHTFTAKEIQRFINQWREVLGL